MNGKLAPNDCPDKDYQCLWDNLTEQGRADPNWKDIAHGACVIVKPGEPNYESPI